MTFQWILLIYEFSVSCKSQYTNSNLNEIIISKFENILKKEFDFKNYTISDIINEKDILKRNCK